jgi:GR25 family glycosyltransferase involved in LPS biosynthesis
VYFYNYKKGKVMKKNIAFLFICLLSLLATPGYGELKDHFKKTEGKESSSKIRNIDFIYMINLDQRPEKFAKASAELAPYGIYPHRFSAVNGWELSLETINDVGLKYKPSMPSFMVSWYPLGGTGEVVHGMANEAEGACYCHCMSRGAIGICLSHISVLQDAWDSGYETIWVMEDDVVCERDPRVVSELIDKLDNLVGKRKWDVFFTDRNQRDSHGEGIPASGSAARPDMDCSASARTRKEYTLNLPISSDFSRISARFGGYSMIIRRSGIKKLLEFAKSHELFLPYDMDNYLDPKIRRYGLRYDVVTNDIRALSDNGAPFYLDKLNQ